MSLLLKNQVWPLDTIRKQFDRGVTLFYKNHGEFSECQHEKNARPCVLRDEEGGSASNQCICQKKPMPGILYK